MSRITAHRGLRKRGASNERGGVTIIVAAVVSMGVALGMMALSLDVGQMMMEKRQLQNGADAAAVYLARSCATGVSCDTTTGAADTTSRNLIAGNSSSASNDVETRCFYNVTAAGVRNDPGCPLAPTQSGAFADCGPLPAGFSSSVPMVQVATKSKAAGSGNLKNWIAPLIGGSANSAVGACSRAAWGSAGFSSGIPITMSMCDWQVATGWTAAGSVTFPASPDYSLAPLYGYNTSTKPWPDFTTRTVTNDDGSTYQVHKAVGSVRWEDLLYTKGTTIQACPHSSPGGSVSGGFDALEEAGCVSTYIELAADHTWWAHGRTGNPAPCGGLAPFLGKVVQVPIYDCAAAAIVQVTNPSTQCDTGHGQQNYYRISGFAAFYLSGWNLSGSTQPSIRMLALGVSNSAPARAATPCQNNDPAINSSSPRCLSGWFVQEVVSATDFMMNPPGGTDGLGLSFLGPAG